MNIVIKADKQELGAFAAHDGANRIRHAIQTQGEATIIVATGASQFEMLAALAKEPDIEWQKVTGFHLDEYVGIPITHGASFRRYLWQRFISQLPLPLKEFHFINGEGDCAAECARLGEIISQRLVDVAFIGIGENGHIAFNDPPADFHTKEPYIVVDLDDACRQQQLGEGWFPTIEDVPKRAISMSVKQILLSKSIVCTVPDARKAPAVKHTVEGKVTAAVPASILQSHAVCTLYLDGPAASQLTPK